MKNEYLTQLPSDLQELVSNIEEASGIEVEVEVDSARIGRHPGEPDPLACVVNESEAILILPSPEHFPEGSVLHELLHMRRFLVEGIPQIAVCEDHFRPELETAFAQWDNTLEHLVIVPLELELRPARRARWMSVIRRVLNSIETVENQTDRDYLVLYSALFAQHVLQDGALQREAVAIVQALSLDGQATEFNNRLLSSLSSKETMVSACVEQFNIERELVCLEYLNPREGTCRQSAL